MKDSEKMTRLYAIVDVETTGSRPGESAITEIGIVISDGEKILSTWSSLVNPGQHIPANISALTGITNAMVQSAPPFADIAQKVYNQLKDKVFVAHHVHFDYKFVQSALEKSGFHWKAEKLCTSQLYKKLFRPEKSSLAFICRHFGIHNTRPHRALPDAMATAEALIRMLTFERDILSNQECTSITNSTHRNQILDELPTDTGVYYLKDESGIIRYVGKAVNIRKRIAQHRLDPEKSRFTAEVEYLVTHSQWLALLLEDSEIQRLRPSLNRAQRKPPANWGIISYFDYVGNHCFSIARLKKGQFALAYFCSYRQAQDFLLQKVKEFSLNPGFCGGSISSSKGLDPTHNLQAQRFICALHGMKTSITTFTGWLQLHDHDWTGGVFLCFLEGHLIGYACTEIYLPTTGQLKRLKPGMHTPYLIRALFSQASPSDFTYDDTIKQAFEHQQYPLLRFC